MSVGQKNSKKHLWYKNDSKEAQNLKYDKKMLSLVHLIWWNHYILLNYLNNSCHDLTYFTASELQIIFSVSVANNLVVLRYVTHCAISLIANLVHKAFYMLHKCCSVEKRFRIVFSWLPQEIIWNTWNTRLGTWKRQFSTMGFMILMGLDQ